MFGKNSPEHQKFLDLEFKSTITAQPDVYITCPTPNCPEYIEARTPGYHEKMYCRRCNNNFAFCSKCKEAFHGIPNNVFKYSSQVTSPVGRGSGATGANNFSFDEDNFGSLYFDNSDEVIEGSFEVPEGEFVGATGLSCEQAKETVTRWNEWRQRDRADFMRKVTVGSHILIPPTLFLSPFRFFFFSFFFTSKIHTVGMLFVLPHSTQSFVI